MGGNSQLFHFQAMEILVSHWYQTERNADFHKKKWMSDIDENARFHFPFAKVKNGKV